MHRGSVLSLVGLLVWLALCAGGGAARVWQAPLALQQARILQGMRALQQEGVVTVVETAEALQEAVVAGKFHIEIRAHLDLTVLDLINGTSYILGEIPVTGNCEGVEPSFTPPTGHAPLRDLLPGQCILLADHNLMWVSGRLWLDGLYVRLTSPRDGEFSSFIREFSSQRFSELWITGVTLQGNGDGDSDCIPCGVYSRHMVYAKGCTFADFDGRMTFLAESDARISLEQCNFAGNTLIPPPELSYEPAVAVVYASALSGSPKVKLDGCVFSNNTPDTRPILLADNRAPLDVLNEAIFYSDDLSPSVCTYEGAPGSLLYIPPCDDSSPLALASTPTHLFLSTSDEWFVEVQQDHRLPSDPIAAPAPAPAAALEQPGASSSPPPPPPFIGTASTASLPALGGEATADETARDSSASVDTTSSAQSSEQEGEVTVGDTGIAVGTGPTPASSSSKSLNQWVIVAAVVAAEMVCALAVGFFIFYRKRRASTAEASGDTHDQEVAGAPEQKHIQHSTFPQATGSHWIQESTGVHPASAHVLSTNTYSSPATGTTAPGNPRSATIGASSTDSHPHQSADVDHMHAHATASVATALNHCPPHAHSAGGQHDDYFAPPPVGMFPPPGATAYGMPPSLPSVAAPPVGAPPPAGTLSALHTAVLLGATRGGAVGQAAAVPQPGALAGVVTRDSVSNYGTQAAQLQAPSANASLQDWKEHLEAQLDSLLGKPVRGTLRVLRGSRNRHAGGQAVVQIVEDSSTSEHYAVKFFLSTSAFNQEKSLYVDTNQPLGKFLPQLHSIVEGEASGLRDASGALMPPCIIMEKGEALDVWIENSGDKIDLFSGLQVLSHIADRLADLHGAGYVHRDIKPGNIMWLPRTKRWTLIDFGCAARTGSHAGTGFSLYYAAPEVLQAYNAKLPGVLATESLDAWSLGILAMELLIGKSVFHRMQPKDETVAMILGDVWAPWENPETSKVLLRPLGILKDHVLELVARDPSQRSSILRFKQSCIRSFSNASITST